MAERIKVGVIGCGYWGPNLVRNFAKVAGFDMVAVADLRQERLDLIKRQYPHLKTTKHYRDILADPDIDAVAVVTPISTHYKIAKEALLAGKHVLIEKPMAQTVTEALELIELAEQENLVLMVDHTFIYTGAIRKIKEIIESGELGEILYFDSIRINLGLFQHDVDVLWDLGPHDFSIMDFLLDKEPLSISAIGVAPIAYNNLVSIAYITINFGDDTIAHFNLSWLSPVKIRRTLIGGSRKMLVYDHLKHDEQVKVYDKGVEIRTKDAIYETLVQYRTGDMYAPKIDQTEALEVECKHFWDCIVNRKKPITDGWAGLRVVKMLQAAQKSMANKGEVIPL